jgi:hypothetical protein
MGRLDGFRAARNFDLERQDGKFRQLTGSGCARLHQPDSIGEQMFHALKRFQ